MSGTAFVYAASEIADPLLGHHGQFRRMNPIIIPATMANGQIRQPQAASLPTFQSSGHSLRPIGPVSSGWRPRR